MKKIFLLAAIVLGCFSAFAQLGVGQQFANNNFERWRNETSSRIAPVSWNSLNSGSGSYQSSAAQNFVARSTDVHPGDTGQYSVQLSCVKVTVLFISVMANGGITSGRFNAGSATASNSLNCTYTSTDSGYHQVMTGYPDSVYVWTKTAISSNSHKAHFNLVIHDSIQSNNNYNAIYQDPVPTAANKSVTNTTGAVNEAKVVAKATSDFRAQNEWVMQKVAFDYNSYITNNKKPRYILATFSTNGTPGTGTKDDKLWFDDIVLIYNTRLASIKVGEVELEGFDGDITEYTYDTPICEGTNPFSCTCASAHASDSVTHYPTVAEPYLTIRVTHWNQADVYKDYTINCTVIPRPEDPVVSGPEPSDICYPVPQNVTLTAYSPDAVSYNWYESETDASYTNVPGTNYTAYDVAGFQTFYATAVEEHGCESFRIPVSVAINMIPAAPVATENLSTCYGNTGVFSATLPNEADLVCHWFESATSSEILSDSTSMEVANITENTSRFVSSYDTVTGCESTSRTTVSVMVNRLPEAPIAIGDTLCGTGFATFTASNTDSIADNIHWYSNDGQFLEEGETFSTNIESDTNFMVKAYESTHGCESTPVEVSAIVYPTYNIEVEKTACDSLVWNNETFVASGIYERTLTSIHGCDSVVTLLLTINTSSVVEFRDDICVNNQYNDHGFDTTFTVAGNYTLVHHDFTQTECDSTTILYLNVNPSYLKDEYKTICESALPYEWNDTTFAEDTPSGDYEYTYYGQTQVGCDSIVTLHLTISDVYLTKLTEHICQGETFEFKGQLLDQTGIYHDTLTAENLCDSIIELNLIVHALDTTIINGNICLGESYTQYGFNVTPENTGEEQHLQTVQTKFGCDSTIILNLTVKASYLFHDTATTCDNEAYVWDGHERIQIDILPAGEHTIWDSLTTELGCDSVYQLVLTVYPTGHSIETASACSNEEPFIWHEQIISETGVYFDTLLTTAWCDSICELRFTLLEPSEATFFDTISYNVQSYNNYGFNIARPSVGDTTLIRTTKNEVGCDSTITVELFVKPFVEYSFDTINCGAVLWNNTWYTESGQYQQFFVRENAFDSLAIMNLIVDTPSRDTTYAASCNSYEWGGTTYTQSGTYQKVYPQIVGCDSIAVLILTINHNSEVTLYDTTCQGERYQYYGFDTLIQQQGLIQLQRMESSILGCDSLIKLNLIVFPSYLTVDSITTCDNQPIQWQGESYIEAGTYTKTYTSAHGCDSTFVLVLNVNPSYNVYVQDTAFVGVQYHKHGISFTSDTTGTRQFLIPNVAVNHCDSIIHLTVIILDNTGIEQHQYISNSITLYPNPAENVFTVNSTTENIQHLTIYDNNGKAVLDQSMNSTTGTINVEALSSGIYFVKFRTSRGDIHKKLIIKQ